MGCNNLNCKPEDIMAAASAPCGQFMKADNQEAEKLVYDMAFNDLINNFGVEINYYVKPFDLTQANLLYGEHPTAIYSAASGMQMYVELSQEALALSQFGFDPGDEFTGYVHIDTFQAQMSSNDAYASINDAEPKSGDLIEVVGMGCDRPGGRCANIYEITERREQDISAINPMLGHYVYRVRAKRYEPSFEPNAPKECVNEQVYDDSQFGVLSSNIQQMLSADVSAPKTYTYDVDQDSKNDVYDQDVNDNDIYGDYY